MLRSIHPKSRVMMGNLNIAMMTSDYDIKKRSQIETTWDLRPFPLQNSKKTSQQLTFWALMLPRFGHCLPTILYESERPQHPLQWWCSKPKLLTMPELPGSLGPRCFTVLDGVDFGGELQNLPGNKKKTYQWNSTPLCLEDLSKLYHRVQSSTALKLGIMRNPWKTWSAIPGQWPCVMLDFACFVWCVGFVSRGYEVHHGPGHLNNPRIRPHLLGTTV